MEPARLTPLSGKNAGEAASLHRKVKIASSAAELRSEHSRELFSPDHFAYHPGVILFRFYSETRTEN